jgi:hypothetical protein
MRPRPLLDGFLQFYISALFYWRDHKIFIIAFLCLVLLLLSTIMVRGYRLLVGYHSATKFAVPGSRLRLFAETMFSPSTYHAVLEPTLDDFLEEYSDILVVNYPWKARRACIRGYWSFWSAVFAQLPISAAKMVYKIWQATR